MLCSMRNATQAPPDPRRADAVAWARRLTRNANDEVFALGREALAWLFALPEADRRAAPTDAYSARLSSWDPERGAQAHAYAQPGFRLWADEASTAEAEPRAIAALFLHIFNYAVRQFVGIDWWSLFFVADTVPDAALRRVEAFKKDALRNPPPLCVHCAGSYYTITRGAQGALHVARHEHGIDAVLAWCDFVMKVREGRVFMQKSINALFKEMVTPYTVTDGKLMAPTEHV